MMRKSLFISAVAVVFVSLFAAASPALTVTRVNDDKLDPGLKATLATLAPGEMTTVIVTLRDRADLAAISGATRPARLKAAILALQTRANLSQVGTRALLRVRARQGKVARTSAFWIVNGLSVTATADVIRELTLLPGVEGIAPDEVTVVPAAGLPEANIAAVGSPAAWSSGYTGQGVVVATLDSGVDLSHPDLASRWRGGTNSWFDPYGQHSASPVDLTGHGTGTMGVMVGGDAGGTSIGMAPGSHWIAARVFDDSGKSTATAIHAAFQWLLDPDGNPNTADAPNVVNSSWSYGYGGTCNLAFQPDVQALRASGIVPVFAAGNFGPGSSTSVSPANYPEALAVGAVNNSDSIYSVSSRGPSACGETSTSYPEIVAPGVGIRTAGLYGTYQVLSGTSLSAPHVAGALALLLSAHPNLSASQQESALEQGAHDLGVTGRDNTFGFGRLDVLGAFNAASIPDFGLVAAPSSATTAVAGNASYTVTVSAANGFADDVALSVSGLPASATASLSPATVTGGSGASQLTVSTSSSIAAATYPLTIIAISGALRHTLGVSLVVTAPADFGISAAPSLATTTAGSSAAYSVRISSLNGFAGDVALSLSGLTSGQASWSLTPTTIISGSGSSQLAIATSATMASGSYPLTITGASGALTRAVQVTLVVIPAPDFTLGVSPSTITVRRSGQGTTTASVGSVGGFSTPVTVSVSGLPSGVTSTFSSNPVAPGAQSTLTLRAARSASRGTFTITVTGVGGGKAHAQTATLTVT
jgi:subtilisin family serine protease